jgi:putative multiple sugar transport system permease protein
MVLLYGFIASKTIIGRHIYAVGGNRHAAELSGVAASGSTSWSWPTCRCSRPRRHDVRGALHAPARSTASAGSSTRSLRSSSAARRSAAGSAPSSGRSSAASSWRRAQQRSAVIGAGADATQMIKGLVLLVAVAFDIYNKSQGRPSITGCSCATVIQRIRR